MRAPPGQGLDAVFIAGPTTSGKSALASRLAERLGGPVINADSMQVYRDLAVLTARPSPAEMGSVPHLLYGHVDGAENFSVGRWSEQAGTLLGASWARGEVPVVVGGTGLYFRALTHGLSAIPAIPDEVRARVRAEAEGRPSPDLHAELARLDPEGAAALRPSDRQRVLRALEVRIATGRPLRTFQDEVLPGPLAGRRWIGLFLDVDRAVLGARIDARFRSMVESSALEEVAALAARNLDPALPVMRAHGVPGLLAHLRGEASLDEAIRRGQADTRAYAKRQVTWFRHQMAGWIAVSPEEAVTAFEHLRDRSAGLDPGPATG